MVWIAKKDSLLIHVGNKLKEMIEI